MGQHRDMGVAGIKNTDPNIGLAIPQKSEYELVLLK